MDTGHYISGIGHASLLGWALIGGLFTSVPEDNLNIAEVSIISEQQFAALSTPVSTPDASSEPVPDVTPEPEAPAPEPTPPAPEPQTPPPTEEQPEEIQPPTPLPTPPVPEPVEPEPTPEPPAPDQPVVLAPPAVTSSPRPARRVAPTPVAPPPPDTEVAEDTNQQTTPDEQAQTQEDPKPATAPEEATDRIVTEADEPPASALKSSSRPRSRPARLAATASPTPPADNSSNSTQDAIAAALAGVQADDNANSANSASSAPTGPPLTGGEKDAFLVDVGRCWNTGSLSTDALESKVVVRFELSREGKPDIGSIKMTGFNGGSAAGAKQAYETARRAIIRCGASGFNLPTDKYEQWKVINITFNPENMRLK